MTSKKNLFTIVTPYLQPLIALFVKIFSSLAEIHRKNFSSKTKKKTQKNFSKKLFEFHALLARLISALSVNYVRMKVIQVMCCENQKRETSAQYIVHSLNVTQNKTRVSQQ